MLKRETIRDAGVTVDVQSTPVSPHIFITVIISHHDYYYVMMKEKQNLDDLCSDLSFKFICHILNYTSIASSEMLCVPASHHITASASVVWLTGDSPVALEVRRARLYSKIHHSLCFGECES